MKDTEKTEPTLLDSRLISPTISNSYSIKLVECGDYIQTYVYDRPKVRNKKIDGQDLNLSNKIQGSENGTKTETVEKIEIKNIIRSKLKCQRLAKANMKEWKTFVTLTIAENVTDVELANKKFSYFIDKVRRIKKDFKYIAVVEFQKRGAIHYHLLTNVEITDNRLIIEQKTNKKYKDFKYWNEGYSDIKEVNNDPKKVIGYISKYMTKDIDDRLFSHKRYLCSLNLEKPKESYICLDDPKHREFYEKKIQGKDIIYSNNYVNSYDGGDVTFLEYLKK